MYGRKEEKEDPAEIDGEENLGERKICRGEICFWGNENL
jgi:hypothetical protein